MAVSTSCGNATTRHNKSLNRSGGWARNVKSTSLAAARLRQALCDFYIPMLPVNMDDTMKPTSGLVLAASLLAALCSGCNSQASPTISSNRDAPDGTAETERVDFAKEVLPILERSCFPCHGPEMSPVSMAGFRVDLREHTVDQGKIVPGDPDESPLIKRLIAKQDSKRMPPLKSDNPQLNAEQIDLLKRWIEEGASYGTQ